VIIRGSESASRVKGSGYGENTEDGKGSHADFTNKQLPILTTPAQKPGWQELEVSLLNYLAFPV